MRNQRLGDVGAVVAAYIPEFQEQMLVSPEDVAKPAALQAALNQLQGPARDLAEALLIAVGGGEALPERFFARVDEVGEPLWKAGVLLPKVRPSRGSTIDPRYYTASSWLNPALARVKPLSEVHGTAEGEASAAPSSAQWDARIVAVTLEAESMRLTQSAGLRKDEMERLINRLGGDTERWNLAMTLARSSGMARVVGGRLHGFPGGRSRELREPVALLEGPIALAAEALLRIVRRQWVSLNRLAEVLTTRCPGVLDGIPVRAARENIAQAAVALQRLGFLEAICDAEGVQAVRVMRGAPDVPRGVIVTSDGEVMVVPGALGDRDFGRLCRLARYQGGDVVYRLRLSREGVAADLEAGYEDAAEWLAGITSAGLPVNITEMIRGWSRVVQRVTVWTGVTVVEEDGQLRRTPEPPQSAVEFDYTEPCLGSVEVLGYSIGVAKSACPLGLKSALDRVFPRDEDSDDQWRWRLEAREITEPTKRVEEIASRLNSAVPGRLEAVLHAAGGDSQQQIRVESAVVLHVATDVLAALRRDEQLGRMLSRVVQEGQVLVAASDLERVREALSRLGLQETVS